jgi:hypothetical protein
MSMYARLLALSLSVVVAGSAFAQAAAPTPAAAAASAPKIALTSLVGDSMSITHRRDSTGTNIRANPVDVVKIPNPVFDHAVLKALQESLARAVPAATVALLRVPAAGSSGDPNQLVVDGNVAATHPLVDGLRQQGFTHLVTATKLRATNVVKLVDDVKIGTGQLEGLGFYIDLTMNVERVTTTSTAQGLIAPHLYMQLSLIDLGTLAVVRTQTITDNAIVASSSNPSGTDPWGAMTGEQKVNALQRLIQVSVSRATPLLFQPQ